MVSTFLAEKKIIKNNVLSVEAIQTEKEININLRTIRMGIKEIQIPNNSSNKKQNNNFKIYLNPERAKAGIAITRVKLTKKKDFKILPLSAIRIIKKKIKFKKRITTSKIPRFSEYIQRAVEKDLLKARKPDFYTVTFPNFIPVIILKLEAKKAAVSILPKDIHFNLFTNSNGKALIKVYTIAPRRFKDEVKAGLNTKKLLTIIISI